MARASSTRRFIPDERVSTGASAANCIDGGDGSDTLIGFNTANTWKLTGEQSGNLNGSLHFSGIENLMGGTSTDSFLFDLAAAGFGALNGGTGSDTLNYSAFTDPVTVDRQLATATAVSSFTAFEAAIGAANAGDT